MGGELDEKSCHGYERKAFSSLKWHVKAKERMIIPKSNSFVNENEVGMVAFRVRDETFQHLDQEEPAHMK